MWDVLRYIGPRCHPSGRIEGDHHLREDETPMREPDDGEGNPMIVISEMVPVGPRVAGSGRGGGTA
jgi:hypothetical protein